MARDSKLESSGVIPIGSRHVICLVVAVDGIRALVMSSVMGPAGTMELTCDAAKLTEASMLRVHELQEGYQSIISKASFSKPCIVNNGGTMAEQSVHVPE